MNVTFFFIFLSLGVAENLCKLFVTDNGIDMTPILRRSKESARRQRSRPESERSQDIPNTRPLAERARPTLPNRKRPFQRYYYSYFSLFSFFFFSNTGCIVKLETIFILRKGVLAF